MNSIKYILLAVLFFSCACKAEGKKDILSDLINIYHCSPIGSSEFIPYFDIWIDKTNFAINKNGYKVYIGYIIINTGIVDVQLLEYHVESGYETFKWGITKNNKYTNFLAIGPTRDAAHMVVPIDETTNSSFQYQCKKPTS